jgi:hypothetical protein
MVAGPERVMPPAGEMKAEAAILPEGGVEFVPNIDHDMVDHRRQGGQDRIPYRDHLSKPQIT